ncbi:TPA: hypothetical protein BOS_6283 [Bos taurus]|nr:TPA: hypothetical protein BOS_6283 [Bos taurus]
MLAFRFPPPRGPARRREATACCPGAAPQGKAHGLDGGQGQYPPVPSLPQAAGNTAAETQARPGMGSRCPIGSRLAWRKLAGTCVPGAPPPQGGPRTRSRSTSLVCRFTSKGGSLLRFTLSPVVPGTRAKTRCVSR